MLGVAFCVLKTDSWNFISIQYLLFRVPCQQGVTGTVILRLYIPSVRVSTNFYIISRLSVFVTAMGRDKYIITINTIMIDNRNE